MSKLASILARHPSICGAAKRTLVRVQRDTLAKSRSKCIAKVKANQAWHRDPTLDKPDTIVAQDGNGTFSVGAKLGNRYLKGIFDGDTFLENVPEAALDEVFDALVEKIEAGDCDTAIKDAMAANRAMHATKS